MVPGDTPSRGNEMKNEKLRRKVNADMDRETVSGGRSGGGLKRWVLPDPLSSFRATAGAPSISSTTNLCSKEVEEARIVAVDPWVRRCRIASIIGGAVLGLGLVVMLVVLAVVAE